MIEPRTSSGRRETVLGLLLIAVGAGLRAWNLAFQSLTYDELYELGLGAEPIGRIVHTGDGFPPLYHVLLHGWLSVFGPDPGARWLSWLLGVVSLGVAWRLGRRTGGSAVGLGTLALLALSPVHVWYSQEGRAYMLFILLAGLGIWLLLRALESDAWTDWIAYAMASATGMYTHYYFSFVLVGCAVVVLLRRGLGRSLARPLAAHAMLAALCVPLLFLLRADFQLQADVPTVIRFDLAALGYTFVSLLTGYTVGPSIRELHTMGLAEAARGFAPLLAVLAPAVAVLAVRGGRVLPRARRLDLAVMIVLPVLLAGLVGQVGEVGYNVRYVAWIVVPMAVWLGAAVPGWRSPAVAASLLVVVGVSAVAIWNRHQVDRYMNEDARAAAAWLGEREDVAPVFVMTGYMSVPIRHYVGGDREVIPIRGLRGPMSQRIRRAFATLESRVAGGQPYWLAYTRSFHGDREGTIRTLLERRHGLAPTSRFAGIEIYRGRVPVREPTPPARPAVRTSAR
jgi:uncharacterized membrane protein